MAVRRMRPLRNGYSTVAQRAVEHLRPTIVTTVHLQRSVASTLLQRPRTVAWLLAARLMHDGLQRGRVNRCHQQSDCDLVQLAQCKHCVLPLIHSL